VCAFVCRSVCIYDYYVRIFVCMYVRIFVPCDDALLINCMNFILHKSVHYSCTFMYKNILPGKREGERGREQKKESESA